MTSITFADERALTVYHSMAEGMEEVQRDNGDPESLALADALVRLIEVTGTETEAYPLTVALPDDLVHAAEITLENCLDNSSGMSADDDDAEDYIFEGQIVLG